VRVDDLDRHLARVAVDRLAGVDHAHATGAEPAGQAVAAELTRIARP
jgi:hypothetical protein